MAMKTILITAYAVNPFKGSEDGTGWNISRQIARYNKVIVITRKNNRGEIERYMREQNDPIHENMTFAYYDLPYWAMFWKKKLGERGYVLYFYLWQLFMPLFIKRKRFTFDATHSLNFHSDSHPHFLWIFNKPSFWGPIGHHPPVPKAFVKPIYGFKTYAKDRMYNAVKWWMRNMDPFFHICKWRTKKIFVINSGVPATISCNVNKTIIVPAVATKSQYKEGDDNGQFNIVSVGRFVFMKGFDITVRAFAQFYNGLEADEQVKCRLTLVGKGEERKMLQNLAEKLGVSSAVNWIDWIERSEMEAIYESSNVFLFPSHEGAGMVVVEAMAKGLPVVCFDNVGPGELAGDAGLKIPYTTYDQSVSEFAETLKKLFENPELHKSVKHAGLHRAREIFNWEYKGLIINNSYKEKLYSDSTANLNTVGHE